MSELTQAQRFALTTRADLLVQEAGIVAERRINWRGRLHELGDFGQAGGSSADRRRIVEAMASLESA